MKAPRFIRSSLTGNILSRYDGPEYTQVIHQDAKGNHITTATVHDGDYTGTFEHQTAKFIEENPELFSVIRP